MYAVLLASCLIPVIALLIIGLLIKYKKAYGLISGYNTMSPEKKRNVDIEGLGRLVANLCFLLAGLILIAAALAFAGLTVLAGIGFALILPVVLYFVVKAQKYDGNTRDENGRMKTGTKVMIGVVIGVFVLISAGVGVLLYHSSMPAGYAFEDGVLKISGMYGQEVPVNEITGLELKDSIPEVLMKTNGSGLGSMLKGYFKLKDIGEAKLFVDTSRKPYIFLTTNRSQLIILNCEEGQKTKELYNQLIKAWQK